MCAAKRLRLKSWLLMSWEDHFNDHGYLLFVLDDHARAQHLYRYIVRHIAPEYT